MKPLYLCDYCGLAFTTEESCRQHEIECSKKVEFLRVVLKVPKDGHIVICANPTDEYSSYYEKPVFEWGDFVMICRFNERKKAEAELLNAFLEKEDLDYKQSIQELNMKHSERVAEVSRMMKNLNE